jgi:hypothetical protein
MAGNMQRLVTPVTSSIMATSNELFMVHAGRLAGGRLVLLLSRV